MGDIEPQGGGSDGRVERTIRVSRAVDDMIRKMASRSSRSEDEIAELLISNALNAMGCRVRSRP